MTRPLLVIALAATAMAARAERPNVLFIAIDDLRPELGCYGAGQVRSPHMDRLAAQAVVFERAYCQVPVCGGSRASLMTGILPTPERFRNARARADEDVPGAVTLPQAFRAAGYTTVSNGKVFHSPEDAADRSWSEPPWVPEMGSLDHLDPETVAVLSETRQRGRIYEMPDVADDAYPDGQIARRTIADLRRLKESGNPFFLACGFLRPHLPFYAPKAYWDLYDREAIEIAGNRERPAGAPEALRGSPEFTFYYTGTDDYDAPDWHRLMRHGYLASVSYTDKLVGDVLDELERLGLAGTTVVVLWGDHGWNLGEHGFWGKHNTMETAVRVPLLVRAPGRDPGRAGRALVECIDLFPTLCALAGIPVPATVQGRSFHDLLRDPAQPFREEAYSRYGRGDALFTPRYAYTRYASGGEMLFDHDTDPREDRNVAGDPAYRDVLADLQMRLAKRREEAERGHAE